MAIIVLLRYNWFIQFKSGQTSVDPCSEHTKYYNSDNPHVSKINKIVSLSSFLTLKGFLITNYNYIIYEKIKKI